MDVHWLRVVGLASGLVLLGCSGESGDTTGSAGKDAGADSGSGGSAGSTTGGSGGATGGSAGAVTGGAAGTGAASSCDGIQCDTPSPPSCTDANTLRTYAASGSCVDGECSYDHVDTTCAAGCANGACLDDPCSGLACNAPPAPVCQNGSTLRTYSSQGTCTSGTCSYSYVDTTCALGCQSGACNPDPCGGKLCNTPPAPSCVNPSTLRTHAAAGTCSGGSCTYGYVDTTCSFGCSAGACNPDPCSGISCNQPPAAVCASTTTLRTYAAAGTCANGACSYSYVDSTCAFGCANGACKLDPCAGVVCNTPPSPCHAASGTCSQGTCSYVPLTGNACNDANACTTGDKCQSGACGGTPKICDDPPDPACVQGVTLRTYSATGTCSGPAGTCSYTYTQTACAGGCVSATTFVPAHCARGSWTPTAQAPLARSAHSAVWTGVKMLVWGGATTDVANAYDPASNTWTTSAPSGFLGRVSHTAVWTGSEMIVWGGHTNVPGALDTGVRYNPATNAWTPVSTTNAPSPREEHTAVWTGSEMLVWGGRQGTTELKTGARYDPATDTWTALPTPPNTIVARHAHAAVWTGNRMIVVGDGDYLDLDVASYTPSTNSWQKIVAPTWTSGRQYLTAVWTGNLVLAWGGVDLFSALGSGGAYELGTDTWLGTLEQVNHPSARYSHTAVWTGTEMIVWGGRLNATTELDTGGVYDPALSEWFNVATLNPPEARVFHSAVWTGSEMIVFGGTNGTSPLATGGRFTPSP
jgi:hypothetical protein